MTGESQPDNEGVNCLRHNAIGGVIIPRRTHQLAEAVNRELARLKSDLNLSSDYSGLPYYKHGEPSRTTIWDLVDWTDHVILFELGRAAQFENEAANKNSARFYDVQSLKNIKQILKAIDDEDYNKFRAAYMGLTSEDISFVFEKVIEREMELVLIYDLGSFRPDMSKIRLVSGRLREKYRNFDFDAYWKEIHNIFRELRMTKSKRGAKRKVHFDNAIGELLRLWEALSGIQATEPWNDGGVSKAKWLDFVREASSIYSDVGLATAVNLNSRSAWARIFAAK